MRTFHKRLKKIKNEQKETTSSLKCENGNVSEPQENESQILLYQTEDGRQRIEVRLQNGSVWLSQKLLAELFGVGVNTVNYHIKEIYKEKELSLGATIRKYRIVQTEGDLLPINRST